MKKIANILQLLALLLVLGCENKIDFDFDPTEVKVQVLDDSGTPLNGALVKVFSSEADYENEKNTGNSNRELLKGFTDASGSVTFGSDDKIDADKDHFFFVSFRDRARFVDLDNFNSSYKLSATDTKKGGKSDVKIQLNKAKSSAKFFSKDLPESSLPLKVYIDGELSGTINKLVSSTPTNTPAVEDGVQAFKLSQGISTYLVVSQTGCVWLGEVKVDATESHEAIGMNACEAGSMTFWVAEADKSLLPITVTLSPNDEIGTLTKSTTTTPTTCFAANTLSVSRSSGEYSYFATSANGNCTWSGRITLPSAGCEIIQLKDCDE